MEHLAAEELDISVSGRWTKTQLKRVVGLNFEIHRDSSFCFVAYECANRLLLADMLTQVECLPV